MNWLVHLWTTLVRLLFSPRCAVCQEIRHEPLCADCEATFVPLQGRLCSMCSDADAVPGSGLCRACQRQQPLFDGTVCRFEHRGRLRRALYVLKFRRRRRLGQALGRVLAEGLCLPATWGVDAVVPVPLHARRMAERGYNQAELLAREVATHLGLPLWKDALVRRQATRPQYQSASSARQANVRGAFAAQHVEGRTILVVDDIMTTGATLNACALALRQAGARNVYGLALSRVVRQTSRRGRAAQRNCPSQLEEAAAIPMQGSGGHVCAQAS